MIPQIYASTPTTLRALEEFMVLIVQTMTEVLRIAHASRIEMRLWNRISILPKELPTYRTFEFVLIEGDSMQSSETTESLMERKVHKTSLNRSRLWNIA